MKNNVFNLKFDNTLTTLTGNTFGRKTFEKQVAGNVNYNEKILIIFPEYIEDIGTSFIQGFFETFVKHIGISGIENNVDIITPKISNIKNIVIKRLTL